MSGLWLSCDLLVGVTWQSWTEAGYGSRSVWGEDVLWHASQRSCKYYWGTSWILLMYLTPSVSNRVYVYRWCLQLTSCSTTVTYGEPSMRTSTDSYRRRSFYSTLASLRHTWSLSRPTNTLELPERERSFTMWVQSTTYWTCMSWCPCDCVICRYSTNYWV